MADGRCLRAQEGGRYRAHTQENSLKISNSPASSSSQGPVFDVNRYTVNPVPERSGITSEEQQRNPLHKPRVTDNKHEKYERREEVQSDLSHELPDWLQEFREREFGR